MLKISVNHAVGAEYVSMTFFVIPIEVSVAGGFARSAIQDIVLVSEPAKLNIRCECGHGLQFSWYPKYNDLRASQPFVFPFNLCVIVSDKFPNFELGEEDKSLVFQLFKNADCLGSPRWRLFVPWRRASKEYTLRRKHLGNSLV